MGILLWMLGIGLVAFILTRISGLIVAAIFSFIIAFLSGSIEFILFDVVAIVIACTLGYFSTPKINNAQSQAEAEARIRA